MSQNPTKEELKAAFKEAIKEWIDERFEIAGRRLFGWLIAAAFGAVVYLVLRTADIESLRPHIR